MVLAAALVVVLSEKLAAPRPCVRGDGRGGGCGDSCDRRLAAVTTEVLDVMLIVVLAVVLVVVLALMLSAALAVPLPAALACGTGLRRRPSR